MTKQQQTLVVVALYIIFRGDLGSRPAVKLIARDLTGKIVFRSPGAPTGGCTPGSTADV